MNWREAYFSQAQDDYRIFREFKQRTDIAMCQKLHYLQMATEKLAKGFLCSPNGEAPPKKVHGALVKFLKTSKGQPNVRRQLGYENYRTYATYIDGILGIAERIERLAPVGYEERLNPEYPWETDDGVICPVYYDFSEFSRQDIIKFQNLTDALFRVVDEF